jgi:flagellar hook-associated protein 1 FlgK
MSLSQSLNAAVAGLRTTQSGLSLVAGNVANAQSPGYVRRTLVLETTSPGGELISVRVAGINRELDRFLQEQVRTEGSGGAYADLKAQFYERLQLVYGEPGSATALETVFNNFTEALQALSTNPADYSARSQVMSAAQILTQQLNRLTTGIQSLRDDAEQGLADSVLKVNDILAGLDKVNDQLRASSMDDGATAALLDQRDAYLAQLSELMDIRLTESEFNQVQIYTNSGFQLLGEKAAQLAFDTHGSLIASSQWTTDPSTRGVGTIAMVNPNGTTIDLISAKTFRSGQIAAYLEMRDDVLVQAQTQLDEFAAGMAHALSDKTIDGVAMAGTPPPGFDVEVGGVLAGNVIEFTYSDTPSGVQHRVTVIRVDDPSILPLSNTTTGDPNDRVIGVDWSGGLTSVVSQLNASFAGRLQFSNPAGTTLRIQDDGVANTTNVDVASATVTEPTLTGGSAELPFFTDDGALYTGAIASYAAQSVGFAGRIRINSQLVADPSKLVVYQVGTASGDTTRPTFIYDQLTSAAIDFSPSSGVGTAASPYSGTLSGFLRQAMSQQGDATENAKTLAEGQGMVVDALKQRLNDSVGVNIDEEMSNLLRLQTAYAANARVMSTVKDMFDTLFQAL